MCPEEYQLLALIFFIVAAVSDHHCYSIDLPQGGLEVPCHLIFKGEIELLHKVKKLIHHAIQFNQKPPKPLIVETEAEPSQKRLKLEVDEEEIFESKGVPSDQWILCDDIQLNADDKYIVNLGNWLSDKHMNFAQKLLKRQNDLISGLLLTLLLLKSTTTIVGPNAVQIIHKGNNHWTVATTVGCVANEVKVFDSLYTFLDKDTTALVLRIFQGSTMVKLVEGPKQIGFFDCGLFAIATATSLVTGISATSDNQSLMRKHLIKCFEAMHLSPFP